MRKKAILVTDDSRQRTDVRAAQAAHGGSPAANTHTHIYIHKITTKPKSKNLKVCEENNVVFLPSLRVPKEPRRCESRPAASLHG